MDDLVTVVEQNSPGAVTRKYRKVEPARITDEICLKYGIDAEAFKEKYDSSE